MLTMSHSASPELPIAADAGVTRPGSRVRQEVKTLLESVLRLRLALAAPVAPAGDLPPARSTLAESIAELKARWQDRPVEVFGADDEVTVHIDARLQTAWALAEAGSAAAAASELNRVYMLMCCSVAKLRGRR
jgi:hypothetical protein